MIVVEKYPSLAKAFINPFKRNAITTLIITGNKMSPKKIIKRKENISRTAKYTDSSLEKNLFINLSNKLCIIIVELTIF